MEQMILIAKVHRHPSIQSFLLHLLGEPNELLRLLTWMTGMILLECLTALSPHLSSRTEVTRWELS